MITVRSVDIATVKLCGRVPGLIEEEGLYFATWLT